jgi:hypothetical protein
MLAVSDKALVRRWYNIITVVTAGADGGRDILGIEDMVAMLDCTMSTKAWKKLGAHAATASLIDDKPAYCPE